MLGVKINEFDNSDGTIKSFNRIFPRTPLEGEGDVEILDIVDRGTFSNNLYMRNIEVNGENVEHDFGENNFYNNADFIGNDSVKFKYFAKDFDGNLLAKGYGQSELAEKLGCNISVIKRRLIKTVDAGSPTDHKFNITRIEL
jgi:hypothetical protein